MKRRVLFALGLLCLTFWCWDQVPSARVTRKEDLREAIATMLATPGPYLLDVIVPHQVGKSCWWSLTIFWATLIRFTIVPIVIFTVRNVVVEIPLQCHWYGIKLDWIGLQPQNLCKRKTLPISRLSKLIKHHLFLWFTNWFQAYEIPLMPTCRY
jgi:hypothetical protein